MARSLSRASLGPSSAPAVPAAAWFQPPAKADTRHAQLGRDGPGRTIWRTKATRSNHGPRRRKGTEKNLPARLSLGPSLAVDLDFIQPAADAPVLDDHHPDEGDALDVVERDFLPAVAERRSDLRLEHAGERRRVAAEPLRHHEGLVEGPVKYLAER